MGMNKVVIDVEARFTDNVSGQTGRAESAIDKMGKAADRAQKKLNSVKTKPFKPVFDADNSRFLKKLRDTEHKMGNLGKHKTKVMLEAVDKATTTIGKVLNTAKKFGRGAYKAVLTVRAVGLNVISKTLSGLRSVTKRAWTATLRVKDFVTAPIQKLKSSLFSIKTLIAAIAGGIAMKKLAIEPTKMFANYEDLVTQFSVLLGSQDAARKRMSSLVDFAGQTPFTRDEIFQASRILQTYTNGALATPDSVGGLKMIGDVAAATGEEYTRVANYFGRLYNEVARGGEALGEPLMMLREIGALSAENEKAITDIAQGSGTIEEKWAQIAQQFSKTDGMMEAMSDQMNNLLLGVKSFIKNNLLMKLGEGISASLKPFLSRFRAWRSENSALIAKWATRIRDIAEIVSGKILGGVEKIASRAQSIMKSPEFQDASLGGKMKMLWKGLVSDPLSEWWNNGGQEKTAKAAGKIGSAIGILLSKALIGLFRGASGAVDVAGAGLDAGASVAGAFVRGFLDNFDGGAIASAFKDAVSSIWSSLPTWGKLLVGGFIGGKVLGGIGSIVGGIGRAGTALAPIIGSAAAGTGLLGLGVNTTIGLGAGNLAGGASLSAGAMSALGLGAIAGGVIGGYTGIRGGIDLYHGIRDHDETKQVSGGMKLGTVATGALIGTMVGGPIGTLIGAGIGGIAGLIMSHKYEDNVRKAKYASEELQEAMADTSLSASELGAAMEKAVNKNIADHLGDVALSLSEVQALAKQKVFGDMADDFERFSTATSDAASAMAKLKNSTAATDKTLWKAGMGFKFAESDKDDIIGQFDTYIQSAKEYVEGKHYEWTTAVSLLVDVESEGGKSILDSGNAFYAGLESQLNDLGSQLSEKVKNSVRIEGGVLQLDNAAEIASLQQQIADITNQLSSAEMSAQMDLIKIKFGAGNLDKNSYDMFMASMQESIQSRMEQSDTEFTTAVTGLKLELSSGAISQEEYNTQFNQLLAGYTAQVDSVRAEVEGVELSIIGDAYKDVLGENAIQKLQSGLEAALAANQSPLDWTVDAARINLGLDGTVPDDTVMAMQTMLAGVFDHVNALDVQVPLNPSYDLTGGTGDPTSQITAGIPDSVDADTTVFVSPSTILEGKVDVADEIQSSVPGFIDATTNLFVSPNTFVGETEDVATQIQASVPDSVSASTTANVQTNYATSGFFNPSSIAPEPAYSFGTTANINPGYKVGNKFQGSASKFGVKSSYSFSTTVTVNVAARVAGNVAGAVSSYISSAKAAASKVRGFRGGIFGGTSSMRGYSDGGIVSGGSQLIKVAEEGSPEMVIPLSSQRRKRGLRLWEKAGEMLKVPGFAQGGRTDNGPDETLRAYRQSNGEASASPQSTIIDVGGVTVQITVQAGAESNVADAVREQRDEIAEEVAGIMHDVLSGVFENTPPKGGAA